MANIVHKYSFLFQNIDVFNVNMPGSFLSQFHLSVKSGRVMFQIGLDLFLQFSRQELTLNHRRMYQDWL